MSFGIKITNVVDQVGLANTLGNDLVTFFQRALLNSHQRHYAQIIVKPGVNDQCLQRRVTVALRWRHQTHQFFQYILDTHAGFGTAGHGLRSINTNNLLNFHANLVGLCLR